MAIRLRIENLHFCVPPPVHPGHSRPLQALFFSELRRHPALGSSLLSGGGVHSVQMTPGNSMKCKVGPMLFEKNTKQPSLCQSCYIYTYFCPLITGNSRPILRRYTEISRAIMTTIDWLLMLLVFSFQTYHWGPWQGGGYELLRS